MMADDSIFYIISDYLLTIKLKYFASLKKQKKLLHNSEAVFKLFFKLLNFL